MQHLKTRCYKLWYKDYVIKRGVNVINYGTKIVYTLDYKLHKPPAVRVMAMKV